MMVPDIYHYAIISGFLGYSQEKQVLHNDYCVTPKQTQSTAKSPFKFHRVLFTEVEAASCSYSNISVPLPFLISGYYFCH